MKAILPITFCLLLITGCQNHSSDKGVSSANANADFDKFKNKFVEELWKIYPGWASGVGYHKYDNVLVIPNDESRKKELIFADSVSAQLNKFDLQALDANNKTDYKLIANFLEGVKFNINEFKSYEWDPSNYNVGDALFTVLDYKGSPLEERLRNLSAKIANVPAFFEAAGKNIYRPAKEQTNLAIAQNKGSLSLFDKTFPDSLKASKLSPDEIALFNKNASLAKTAIENYVSWLQKTILDKGDSTNMRSFRIGKDLYAKKFMLDIDSRYTAAEMYQKATDRKDELHRDMAKLTKQLWKKYMGTAKQPDDSLVAIKQLVDKISLHHCKKEDFLATIEKQLPELTAFINSHHIIGLDSTKPLKVRKTPDYLAGVAGAGINSPGPYDKDATTYYNVTPLTNYSAADAESYLREYNDYVLQILNTHEAIPGHYTQLIYANRSPSIIKALFGNGAMIEGWACYVERMMLEEGYNPSPEMQLIYDKWNLREASNLLIDYNIQCNNWSEKQVMDMLVNETFQEQAEAKEKWNRATLSQVQLASYFTGLTEIYQLREEIKQKKGKDFDLKKFHEQFLSYGSAPVKEIRELMMK